MARETTQNDKDRPQNSENEVGNVGAPSLCYSQPESRWDLDNIASCSLYSAATFVTSIWEMTKMMGWIRSGMNEQNLENDSLSLKITWEWFLVPREPFWSPKLFDKDPGIDDWQKWISVW